MPFIRDNFALARIIPLAGFTGDPDWVDDYDADGARIAGVYTCIPQRTGQVDVVFSYIDATFELLGPDPGSSLDFEVIALGAGNVDPATVNAIFTFEVVNNHSVEEIATLDRKLGGVTQLGLRIYGLSNTPAAAVFVSAAMRVS